jgi:trans-aconitate methyltransferase
MSGLFRTGEQPYEDFMGRYSRRLAPLFAEFIGVAAGDRILDVGAGTGALTDELLRREANVAAVEPSPEFCEALQRRLPDVEVRQAGAEELPFADDRFDVAAAQLVVAFMADAPGAMREMARVAPVVAICMWGVEEMEMFAAIGRTAQKVGGSTEASARRYRTQAELVGLLEPFGDVETADLDVTASYSGYDDFWNALCGQVGPAGAWLSSLDENGRAVAHDELHRQLGGPEGPFELQGRCYAAKVTRA